MHLPRGGECTKGFPLHLESLVDIMSIIGTFSRWFGRGERVVSRRAVLVVLCVTEITSWGILFYAFPVLAGEISATTGWSLPVVNGAFSTGLVCSALTGLVIGRILDRRGPRTLMTTGSVLAAPALCLVAAAGNLPVFFAGWMFAGIAMGMVLYPPAFAAVTRWWTVGRTRALTTLTIVGGLASTVFAPLTALLSAGVGWRSTYLILAAALFAITVPAHFFGLRRPWDRQMDAADRQVPTSSAPSAIIRSVPFIALVTAVSLAALASFAAVVNLVPLLTERGIDTTLAATALGIGGIGQVLGRLGYSLFERLPLRLRTALVLLATTLTTALLGLTETLIAALLIALAAGVARGIFTLLHATAVTDRWGSMHYGRLTALVASPIMLATALAPWAGAGLAAVFGSYSRAFLVLAAINAIAVLLAFYSVPRTVCTPGRRT